jgi:hypothetical protein
MSSSEKNKKGKENNMDNKNSCPMQKCPMGGFCWKNPVHWFFGLAVLPFALEGLKLVWAAVSSMAN